MTKGKRGSLESIEVKGELTSSGVKASVKSRTATAFDRYLGSFLDQFTAKNEARTALVDDASNTAVAIQNLQGQAELELERRRLAAVLERDAQKQLHREEIAYRTIDELKLTASDETVEVDTTETPLDDDWLDQFGALSENASTERMQGLWARILAGEIRKPGSFSLTTLAFLTTLDQQVASLFEKYMADDWGAGLIPKPDEIEGKTLEELSLLEEVGLLIEIAGFRIQQMTAKDSYINYFLQPKESRTWAMRIKPKDDAKQIEIPIIGVTRIGREVARLLPHVPPHEKIRRFLGPLAKHATEIRLMRLKFEDGEIHLLNEEIFPPPVN